MNQNEAVQLRGWINDLATGANVDAAANGLRSFIQGLIDSPDAKKTPEELKADADTLGGLIVSANSVADAAYDHDEIRKPIVGLLEAAERVANQIA